MKELQEEMVEFSICGLPIDEISFVSWEEQGNVAGSGYELYEVDMDELREKWARENRVIREKKTGVRTAIEVGVPREGEMGKKNGK